MTSLTATGTFRAALLAPAPALPADQAAGGKPASAGGKDLPANAPDADRAVLEAAARELEKRLRTLGHALRFEVNLDGGQAVIQVLDRETGEVIRRIPREKLSTFVPGDRRFDIRLFDERV